jgi:hypothetical protein
MNRQLILPQAPKKTKTLGPKQRFWPKRLFVLAVVFFVGQVAMAQCSICTKTASQLGEGPASALNSAIIYLAAAPLAIMGFIGWRWWKNEKSIRE